MTNHQTEPELVIKRIDTQLDYEQECQAMRELALSYFEPWKKRMLEKGEPLKQAYVLPALRSGRIPQVAVTATAENDFSLHIDLSTEDSSTRYDFYNKQLTLSVSHFQGTEQIGPPQILESSPETYQHWLTVKDILFECNKLSR